MFIQSVLKVSRASTPLGELLVVLLLIFYYFIIYFVCAHVCVCVHDFECITNKAQLVAFGSFLLPRGSNSGDQGW